MEKEYKGLLKIASEADRITICSILFKHGYTVSPVRRKKERGNTYEYLIKYELLPKDLPERRSE